MEAKSLERSAVLNRNSWRKLFLLFNARSCDLSAGHMIEYQKSVSERQSVNNKHQLHNTTSSAEPLCAGTRPITVTFKLRFQKPASTSSSARRPHVQVTAPSGREATHRHDGETALLSVRECNNRVKQSQDCCTAGILHQTRTAAVFVFN